ncbi:hypothetical protein PAAG_01772 [Paracoccidioides lutzii Pb01]|uniref:Uncharacterized protein n=1 Tax=Paracoccidioides lutzii (strain ATCC MYA-826 / Pb01) TaxID=502779 RepID=C1GTC7_PARBA|nr:hypothetical protein PAAG_01772 [Paracoccidioides lutzii Pb01]EEH39310.2 hypothetical protein PAAG_01772 [Paracoccidioides lutzii Pb01]
MMVTPLTLGGFIPHNGIPPLYATTWHPQPHYSYDIEDDQTDVDIEITETASENNIPTENSSILSDSEIVEGQDPYLFYVLPKQEDQHEMEDPFVLIIAYRRDEQLSQSTIPDGDQVNLWTNATPHPYENPNGDEWYSDHSGSIPSSMVNSVIIDPDADDVTWGRGSCVEPVPMTCSSFSSSQMALGGWSESTSVCIKYAGSHLAEMLENYAAPYPEAISVT